MDSKTRILIKAITWQVTGLFSMMLIGFLFTGSLTASGGIAVVSAVTGFVFYFVHEIAWSKICWGRGILSAIKK
jgi:uncharacterized membrane protein